MTRELYVIKLHAIDNYYLPEDQGKNWAQQFRFAKKFQTYQEAKDYIYQYFNDLEKTRPELKGSLQIEKHFTNYDA